MLATRLPDLRAAVPFYGSQPKAEDVPKIKAPLLIHYAEKDDRINAGWPAYEAALKANKVPYERVHLPRHPARLQQRHDPALRQGRREPGLAAHGGVLQQAPAGIGRGGWTSRASSECWLLSWRSAGRGWR